MQCSRLLPLGGRRKLHWSWARVRKSAQLFSKGLTDEVSAALVIFLFRDDVKIWIGNGRRRGLDRLAVAAIHPAPAIAVAGIGQGSNHEAARGSESRGGKILSQRAPLTGHLIEAPEFCGRFLRLDGSGALIVQEEHI